MLRLGAEAPRAIKTRKVALVRATPPSAAAQDAGSEDELMFRPESRLEGSSKDVPMIGAADRLDGSVERRLREDEDTREARLCDEMPPTVGSLDWHYAQGDLTLTTGQPYSTVRIVGWAFRRQGSHRGKLLPGACFRHTEVCQGLWQCPACPFRVRPLTGHDTTVGARPRRAEQCLTCRIPLEHRSCTARVSYCREKIGGSMTVVLCLNP